LIEGPCKNEFTVNKNIEELIKKTRDPYNKFYYEHAVYYGSSGNKMHVPEVIALLKKIATDYEMECRESKNKKEKEEIRIAKRQEIENKLKDLRESARQGDRIAQYQLGVISEEGEMVPRNLNDAMTWYDRSVSQGHIDAKKGFDRVVSILKERGRLEDERKEQERLADEKRERERLLEEKRKTLERKKQEKLKIAQLIREKENKRKKEAEQKIRQIKRQELLKNNFGYKDIKLGMTVEEIDGLGVCASMLQNYRPDHKYFGKKVRSTSSKCYGILGKKRTFKFTFNAIPSGKVRQNVAVCSNDLSREDKCGALNSIKIIVSSDLNPEKIHRIKNVLNDKYGLSLSYESSYARGTLVTYLFVYGNGKVVLEKWENWMCEVSLGDVTLSPHLCMSITYNNSEISKKVMLEIRNSSAIKKNNF